MFGLTLANPALWAGIFALGLPLAIHLMTRRTPVRLVFPTIRFLQEVRANQSRIFRVRHWLMLALRTLAILLILLAFLRPEYRARALVPDADESASHAAVVLLDTSVSMRYAGEGFSPFGRAKVVAERVLNDLGADDVAGVIFMGAQPKPAFEELRKGVGALTAVIQEREATFERADVDAAVALALRQLEAFPTSVHEIHFVSDFQRTNWAAVNFAAIPEDVRVVFEAVGHENASNLAITEVGTDPPYPVVGEATRITVKVANYSDTPRDVPVTVAVGGDQLPERRVALDAQSSAAVQFDLGTQSAGLMEGTATIPVDGLTADDIRRFTVSLTERTPVVILTDNVSGGPDAAHRFIRAALDPLGGERTMFEPRTLSPHAFDRSVAGTAQVVVVTQAHAFREETAEALAQYVQDGGGVIYFLSEPSDADNVALLEELSEDQFTAPFAIGRMYDAQSADDAPFALLQQANYDHPILRKFRDTGALAALQFGRYFETTRRETEGQILLRYDNGHAALAYRTYGLGSVLLANFTVDARTGTLPKSPVFVPLVHEMVKAMRPHAGAARDFVVGEPAAATVRLPDAEAHVRFSDPKGREVSAGLDVNDTEGTVIFKAPDQPGFWRILTGDQRLGSVPVNVDARESDLAILTVDQLRELTKFSRDRFLAQQGVDHAGLRALRHGLPFWHYLFIAALAALAIEQLFTWRWKR